MLVGVFGCLTANAFTVTDNGNGMVTIDCNNDLGNWTGNGSDGFTQAQQDLISQATYLKFTGTIGSSENKLGLFQNHTVATTVDFGDAYFNKNVAHEETYYQYNPTSTVTPKYSYNADTKQYVEDTDGKYIKVTATYHTNDMSFQWFEHCETAIISTHIDELSQNAFANCANISSFEIPANIKFFATGAVDNTPITSINIPATVEYLASGSIKNASTAALLDVTVNSAQTACANGAFLKDITVGQTDAGKEAYAVLHFPADAEEYFVNYNDPLTQAVSLDKGKFQSWLNSHYDKAGNGWQEFINSGTGDPIPPAGNSKVVLRTYSDNVARLVPLNFRAYLVNGITEEKVGDKTNYKVTLEEIFAIPANTGVILYGEIDSKMSGYTLSRIPAWDDTPENRAAKTYVAPYNRDTEPTKDADGELINIRNYLVPTVTSTKLYPVTKTDGVVTDRNFVMCPYSTTTLNGAGSYSGQANDFVGFFRVIGGTNSGDNRAYLSLPTDKYKSAKGAEAIVVKYTNSSDTFRSDKWNNPVSGYNWGLRDLTTVLEAKFAGEVEDEVNGISTISSEVKEDNNYFTLQGVKVSQPQKGVYIHNGKKVIIK